MTPRIGPRGTRLLTTFARMVLFVTVIALPWVVEAPGATASTPADTPVHALPGLAAEYTTESDRYVVYTNAAAAPRTITVLDTKTLTYRRRTLPADCFLYAGPDGPPVASGRSLFPCERRDLLMDLRSGELTTLPLAPDGDHWWRIGRRWLEASGPCDPSDRTSEESCRFLLDLKSGAIQTRPDPDDQDDVQYDLDDPDPAPITFCAPLQGSIAVEPIRWQQHGGFALLELSPLTIGRCGHRRRIKVGGPDATTRSASLAGGWLSYYRDSDGCARSVYAYRPSTKRTYRWATPSVRGARCVDDAIHTQYAIVVPLIAHIDRETSEELFTYRLVVARLPH